MGMATATIIIRVKLKSKLFLILWGFLRWEWLAKKAVSFSIPKIKGNI